MFNIQKFKSVLNNVNICYEYFFFQNNHFVFIILFSLCKYKSYNIYICYNIIHLYLKYLSLITLCLRIEKSNRVIM